MQYQELCDIQAVSWGSEKYHSALRSAYAEMAMSPEQLAARKNPRVFDCDIPERADAAAAMFKQFLGQAKKLEGINV